MKVLHLIKTATGATWACDQIEILRKLGVDITVLIPPGPSLTVSKYEGSNCKVIRFNADFPAKRPQELKPLIKRLRRIIDNEKPDIMHSHFVGTTLSLRLAIGRDNRRPKIFQVPGPLHLENWFFRKLEINLSGESDYWIGSSRYIVNWYRKCRIPEKKLFLSYYGFKLDNTADGDEEWDLRTSFGIPKDKIVVGNINFIYPPKYYLGHRVGVKCHEDVIEALGEVMSQDDRVVGLFVGGPWGNGRRYEMKLREKAEKLVGDRIVFTGFLPPNKAAKSWKNFDLCVHAPLSENCGGVVEPLFYRVPVIASRVGGLPEVVIPGKTGWLVPPRQPHQLAKMIESVLANLEKGRQLARAGKTLVRTMFNVSRTAFEIYEIYKHILNEKNPPPKVFEPENFLKENIEVGESEQNY